MINNIHSVRVSVAHITSEQVLYESVTKHSSSRNEVLLNRNAVAIIQFVPLPITRSIIGSISVIKLYIGHFEIN